MAGVIQISESTWSRIAGAIDAKPRGTIELKGRGTISTWLVERRHGVVMDGA